MKCLLDANLPFSAKEVFPDNFNVIHVRDIGLESASDSEIIFWAKKNKAVLFTRDLDFANILNFPPQKYAGIVVLRIPSFYSAKNIKALLKSFMVSIDSKQLKRSVIIVEVGRYRIRQ